MIFNDIILTLSVAMFLYWLFQSCKLMIQLDFLKKAALPKDPTGGPPFDTSHAVVPFAAKKGPKSNVEQNHHESDCIVMFEY
jgi:hypothetical protein